MRKIKHIKTETRHGSVALPVDWGKTFLFKNKDKAKRAATRLNLFYTNQLELYNNTFINVFQMYRHYWLFLSEFDNRQMKQRMQFIMDELDHAITYQDQYYNSPADLSRISTDLAAAVDTLLLYATKRKDIPNQHTLKILKQRIEDDYNRNPSVAETKASVKRSAIRTANG